MSFSSWIKRVFRKEKPVGRKTIPSSEDRVNGTDALYLRTHLPQDLARIIFNATGLVFPDRTAYEETQARLLNAIHSYSADQCACDDWKVLYRHLIRHGYFRIAVAARNHAISRAYLDAKQSDAHVLTLHTGFTAAIDQADFPFAKECLDRVISCRQLRADEVRRMQSYYDLNVGSLQVPDGRMLPKKCHLDTRFHDYIKGRSVAVVGPAPPRSPAGEEIESFDVVSRPNYSGNKGSETHRDMGKRTDVSFFANGIVKMSNAHEPDGGQIKKWINELDWAFIKNTRMSLSPDLTRTGKILPAAKDTLMFHGTPMLGPISLHTVLTYGASRVKVFNSNFHYSANPYAAHYQPHLVADVTTSRRHLLFGSMASHDFLSQVHFVRNLHRAGLVELNPESLEVVNLSSAGYLEGLERIFVFPLYG